MKPFVFFRRIRNLVIHMNLDGFAVYYYHTPYKTSGFAFNLFNKWHLGYSRELYLRVLAFGPSVVCRCDVLQPVR